MNDLILDNLARALEIAKPGLVARIRDARSLEELEPFNNILEAIETIQEEFKELETAGML